MATLAETFGFKEQRPDVLSGTPRAHAIDRWIFVFMALWFIAITLTGFIPDSMMKVGMVKAGLRPPFPTVLHMHAVVMGSFLLVLLAQAWLMATGRRAYHMQLGLLGYGLGVLLVLVGFVLVPTMYGQVWDGAHFGPPQVRAMLQERVPIMDDIALLQFRIGILFAVFMAIAFRARGRNAGMHKRMMFLAIAGALPAAFDRITWLPTTMPTSPVGPDLWVLFAIAPMFLWDVLRNRNVHPAYIVWLVVNIPFAIAVHSLWDTPWWHQMAPRIMGVA